MKFTLSAIVALSVAAAPVVAQSSYFHYACKNTNLDECRRFSNPTGKCADYPADYTGVISSVDTQAGTCIFYNQKGCASSTTSDAFAGFAKNNPYLTIPASNNDKLSSYVCGSA